MLLIQFETPSLATSFIGILAILEMTRRIFMSIESLALVSS